MGVCEIDCEVPDEVVGFKLPTWQILLLHRAVPSCAGLVLYLTLMCYDIALTYGHFESGSNGVAAFCIILITLPALLTFIFTLALEPQLQVDYSAEKSTITKNASLSVFLQLLNLIFFPIAAIGRYCHQIFWWIEAVFAAKLEDEERLKEALLKARERSPLELYLFLQAFIHAAPHAILNIIYLMNERNTGSNFDKVSIQFISVIASTLRMASTATLYRRFEREKICGRKYPWNNSILNENSANENVEKTAIKKQDNIYDTVEKRKPRDSTALESISTKKRLNSDLITFSYKEDDINSLYEESDTESYLEYLRTKDNDSRQQNDSDEEYVRPISIIDRVAPRRSTQYTIEEVNITPPPETPAPRYSLAVWAEKIVVNAEAIPSLLSAPPRRRHYEKIVAEPDIPTRIPSILIRGLEPQDFTAAVISFMGWYLFFVSRLLSMAIFIKSFLFAAVIILFSHYQIVLLLLIVPKASSVKRSFYLFLAFIYLFCLMEFKIRFRHVRAWHMFWFIICTVETIVFTGVWAVLDNDINSWWKQFIILVILSSSLLSYLCMLFYYVILKPKETLVFIKK